VHDWNQVGLRLEWIGEASGPVADHLQMQEAATTCVGISPDKGNLSSFGLN
jgi:hypothetical protein